LSSFAPDIYLNFSDLLHLLAIITLVIAIVLLVVAAWGDSKNRRISNRLTATIAAFALCRLALLGDPIAACYTAEAALVVFFIAVVLFVFRVIGGGDVKLLTATVLVVGYHAVFPFLAIMSICGAALSIAILVMRRQTVPYGVAITAGAIVTLSLQTSIIG
jgi:prepilin peptidase CpaA